MGIVEFVDEEGTRTVVGGAGHWLALKSKEDGQNSSSRHTHSRHCISRMIYVKINGSKGQNDMR